MQALPQIRATAAPPPPAGGGLRTADAAAALREMIVLGTLPAGERIVERTVCAQLGVSRTPLREALKLLAHEGLVELVPHCGARVTRLTPQEGRQLFAVLGALEALAAGAASIWRRHLENTGRSVASLLGGQSP